MTEGTLAGLDRVGWQWTQRDGEEQPQGIRDWLDQNARTSDDPDDDEVLGNLGGFNLLRFTEDASGGGDKRWELMQNPPDGSVTRIYPTESGKNFFNVMSFMRRWMAGQGDVSTDEGSSPRSLNEISIRRWQQLAGLLRG